MIIILKSIKFIFILSMLYWFLPFDYAFCQIKMNNVDSVLKEIYKSDQNDRGFLLDSLKTMPIDLLNTNDSIRLSKIISIDNDSLLSSQISKYYAAFIYHHNGSSIKNANSKYEERAIQLCDEILNSSNDEFMQDTLSLYDLRKTQLLDIFGSTIANYLAPDTLININKDTMLVFTINIKTLANSLKNFASQGLNTSIENNNNSETIHIDKIDDPQYLLEIRKKLKEKIITKLKDKQPELLKTLSDAQIEKLVDEDIQMMKNIKNNLIEDIKANPKKYK